MAYPSDSMMGHHASAETYDTETQKWKKTSLKLKKPKGGFGYLSVKLGILREMIATKANWNKNKKHQDLFAL